VLYFESFKEIAVQETAKSARVFRFGVFEVDAATGELRKQGLRIGLQQQPCQILLMLLDRAGEVVSREEIRRNLWPPDTFVDFDQSLGTALRKVRQALCDDAETPRYIETIPKHGFRFVAPVERLSASPQRSSAVVPIRTSEPPGSDVKQAPGASRRVPFVSLAQPIRSSILPPSYCSFEPSSFSISPDGARLTFVAFGPDGKDKLWVRALSSSNAQQINGTDGALLPFWSPDSRQHVALFSARGKALSVFRVERSF
jgi:DNA-binding winged helix-turn-helix (wHTH) protein